jgi:hypothetical protein
LEPLQINVLLSRKTKEFYEGNAANSPIRESILSENGTIVLAIEHSLEVLVHAVGPSNKNGIV